MAQRVGYFEDVETFDEGPFVMVWVGSRWRIENQFEGNRCPALPDLSIYRMLDVERRRPRPASDEDGIASDVDWLNEQVRLGRIVQDASTWVCPAYDIQKGSDPDDR